MCNFVEPIDKVPNSNMDNLSRLLSSGVPVKWDNDEDHAETTGEEAVEATGEYLTSYTSSLCTLVIIQDYFAAFVVFLI